MFMEIWSFYKLTLSFWPLCLFMYILQSMTQLYYFKTGMDGGDRNGVVEKGERESLLHLPKPMETFEDLPYTALR